MKNGDFLIPREDFQRKIYNTTWKNGKPVDVDIIDDINFIKGHKYLIVNINENDNFIKIEYKPGKTVSFSITDGKDFYECYDKLFVLDSTKNDRKEKLKRLNKISQCISFTGTTKIKKHGIL